MYIQDLQTLQKYVNVATNFEGQFGLITSQETISVPKYFLNWMSIDLITEINGFATEPDGSIKKRGYNLMLGAMCRFALLEFSYSGELEIGSGGIFRHESEVSKTPYLNQIKTLRNSLEDNGYFEINSLVDLMNESTTVFTKWSSSPGSFLNSKLLIKTSKEFNGAKRLYRASTTFQFLVPDMQIQQDLYLSTAFPDTLLNELITNNNLSAEKKQLRSDLVLALVHFTLALSIKTGLVKLSGEGVQVIEESQESASRIHKAADLSRITITVRELEDTGHRYINKAQQYIQNNSGAFSGVEVETPTGNQPKHIFSV